MPDSNRPLSAGASGAGRAPTSPAAGPVVIPVASGKGGVGKSFVAANLALALAGRGHRTIAADLDFGGSNLYHFLGLPNRNPGIGDFLSGHARELAALCVPTAAANLAFLPGDGRTPFLANLDPARKRKLLRRLLALPADFLVLDLGAGSAFTTLDCFAAAETGLVVTTPETPAIMGMLVFLKHHLYRLLERRLAENGCRGLKPLFRELVQAPTGARPGTVGAVQARLGRESRRAAQLIAETLSACRPRIVFNLGAAAEEAGRAESVARVLRETLGIEPDFFGFVFDDPAVREASRRRAPYLLHYPESPAAEGIRKLAERVEKYWRRPVPESARLMARHLRQPAAAATAGEPPAPTRPARFALLNALSARTRGALARLW
jgi:flagellar biosynthesis protein FlhG